MSLSKIVLSGQIIKQPEKRYTPQNNIAKTEFFVGVDSWQKDQKNDPSPLKVITWRDLAEKCSAQLSKGDFVVVEGRLQVNTLVAQDGTKRRAPEIEAISVEPIGQQQGSSISVENVSVLAGAATKKAFGSEDLAASESDLGAIFASEDEIPF